MNKYQKKSLQRKQENLLKNGVNKYVREIPHTIDTSVCLMDNISMVEDLLIEEDCPKNISELHKYWKELKTKPFPVGIPCDKNGNVDYAVIDLIKRVDQAKAKEGMLNNITNTNHESVIIDGAIYVQKKKNKSIPIEPLELIILSSETIKIR